ncbi:MAG: family 43 glycosylhydrolase, partial [Bacteroidota bacterium]
PIQVDQPVFDPSLFFDDDGKVYYTRRGDFKDKDIVQAEIDVKTGKLLTPLRGISKGLISDDTEGPHLFKANGWYYLTMGEGGSRALHMQTIARSKSPWGPFEANPNNPIISQHNAWWHHIRALGHADFVEAPNGSWWAVCLGTRHSSYDSFSAIGRETFLLPVQWVNDWPVIKPEHRQKLEVNVPTLPLKPWPAEPTKDEFEGAKLGLSWNLLSYASIPYYSLSERKGFLRLKGTSEPLWETHPVAFVGCRQKEMIGECTTELEFLPTTDREEAGITAFQNSKYHYDLFVTLRNGKKVAVLRKSVGDMVVEAASIPVQGKRIKFKISADLDKYTFRVADESGAWKELGTGNANLISTEVAQVWSGVLLGMYSTGNGKACKNPADFDWFEATFQPAKLVSY